MVRGLYKLAALMVVLSTMGTLGCAYGGVTAVNKGKEVIIVRNDFCLYGILRKVYACEVNKSGGLGSCKETTAP